MILFAGTTTKVAPLPDIFDKVPTELRLLTQTIWVTVSLIN